MVQHSSFWHVFIINNFNLALKNESIFPCSQFLSIDLTGGFHWILLSMLIQQNHVNSVCLICKIFFDEGTDQWLVSLGLQFLLCG